MTYPTARMEIDISAIAHNYQTLCSLAPQSTCAPVLKANAYGFGLEPVATLLADQGCEDFFVAHPEEALHLRKLLPTARIYVLSGLLPNSVDVFLEYHLTPVLNDPQMLEEWSHKGNNRPCVIHVDTGMNRSGFDYKDLPRIQGLNVQFVMSHLVASHTKTNPLNTIQQNRFEAVLKLLPFPASLADTGGMYLGSPFHYDVIRPGKGLFGLYPGLRSCLTLKARVLQVRDAAKGETVGYDATCTLTRDSKLATLGIGFADGYDRRLSNTGHVLIKGTKAPILGRISMDYTVVDITDVPQMDEWADLISPILSLDEIATTIGTISRELTTTLGPRVERVYK